MSQRGTLRRDGRTWRLDLRVTGEPGQPRERRSFRLGTTSELPTRSQARAAADRLVNRITPAKLNAATVMPWALWCDRYVDAHAAMLAMRTAATQRSLVNKHLRGAFPGFAVHEIDAGHVQALVSRWHEAGASATTVGARFSVLRRVMRTAEASGLAVRPLTAKQVRLPVVQTVFDTVRSKSFTLEEAARIITAAPIADACAYACCLYLGLRSGECLGLAWHLIDLGTGIVHVRQQAQDGKLIKLKSKSSEALLQAPTPLLERLKAYRQTWSAPAKGDLLFADEHGRPWRASALRDRLHDLLEQLGIQRHGLHAFRHAAAFALAGSSCSPEVIRRAMRHSSLRTTAVYLSATPADIAQGLEAAAGQVERAMARVIEART